MPYSCSQCAEAPAKLRKQLQKERGCTKPSKVAVWASDREEWYTCPLKFATQQIYDWRESMIFGDRFGGLQYDRLPSKWIEAWKVFEAAESRLRVLQRKEPASSQNLSALSGVLHGRRTKV